MLGDKSLKGEKGLICGANEIDKHLVHVNIERDIPALEFGDLRLAKAGDGCPRCDQGTFDEHRGIEVGQTFYLGKKYSQAMNAGYLDAEGKQHAMEMGCYGIGITRTVAAAIEQNHDDAVIILPKPLAPLDVHIVPINWNDESTRNLQQIATCRRRSAVGQPAGTAWCNIQRRRSPRYPVEGHHWRQIFRPGSHRAETT